jgi:hypothetical protein
MTSSDIIPKENHLQFLLDELIESGHVHMLNGVIPVLPTSVNGTKVIIGALV